MKKYTVLILLIVILIIGTSLRLHDLNRWPREGATFDEFAWTYLGMSLLNTGIPTSWSPHKAYTNRTQYINPNGASFYLVTPYLEHPPLFGLLAGGYARLTGAKTFDDVTIARIRPFALILGVLAILSVYLLASTVLGKKVGLLSSFIYAVTPSIVAGSRMVQNENFFIPFFLFSLYFAYQYLKKKKTWLLYVSALIGCLLPLAKVPWIAAPIALVALYLYTKKYKEAGIVCILTLLSIGLFFGYGYYFDKDTFLALWRVQLNRYDLTFNSIFTLFTDPLVTDRLFVDGWIYIGFFCMAIFASLDIKKTYPILFGFLAYLLIFATAIPSESGHGWYRYPFYPFLSIATATILSMNFNKNYILSGIGMLLVGLSMLTHAWLPSFGFSFTVMRFFILAIALGMSPVVFHIPWIKKYANGINYILLCGISILSILSSLSYNEQ